MQRQRRAVFISGAVIVAAGLAAYGNSFSGPFILDDPWNIAANPSIRHLARLRHVLSPPPGLGVAGRPLYNLSFALNYAVSGTAVWGYHAVNLAVHLLAGLTLFGVARRSLDRRGTGFQPVHHCFVGPPPTRKVGMTPATLSALSIALLWTIHPLLTGSVTYISERSELLMGLFYLLTLYCFIRSWFSLSVAACLCGMACKEVMVTAPLVVLLYDRCFVAGSLRDALRLRWRYYLGLACTWLLLAWLMSGSDDRRVGFDRGVTPWAYAATESKVVIEYLRLAVWPNPLALDYDLPVVHSAAEIWPYAVAGSALVLGTGFLLFRGRRSPASFDLAQDKGAPLPFGSAQGGGAPPLLWVGFLGAFFFLMLAPTSSVIPVRHQPMAENRMYLPLIAIVALAVLAIQALAGRFRLLVFAALAGGLIFATVRRNTDYRSGISIWTDTVVKRPESARAHSNLGAALYRVGRKDEAVRELSEAVRIDPDDPLTHLMFGNLLAEQGRRADAIHQYREALRIDPTITPARERLENLLR